MQAAAGHDFVDKRTCGIAPGAPIGGCTPPQPARNGVPVLVPPTVNQPLKPYVSYIAGPVAGSATAAISLAVRCEQPGSCCHHGFFWREQPLLVPIHTASLKPRFVLESIYNEVPPTEMTLSKLAGSPIPLP